MQHRALLTDLTSKQYTGNNQANFWPLICWEPDTGEQCLISRVGFAKRRTWGMLNSVSRNHALLDGCLQIRKSSVQLTKKPSRQSPDPGVKHNAPGLCVAGSAWISEARCVSPDAAQAYARAARYIEASRECFHGGGKCIGGLGKNVASPPAPVPENQFAIGEFGSRVSAPCDSWIALDSSGPEMGKPYETCRPDGERVQRSCLDCVIHGLFVTLGDR